jgi:glycosyltransferase involved in cell wall biosynthesis
MNKVKVLHCIRQGMVGGGESHLIDLINNLDTEKFESYVLSFTDGPMITHFQSKGIQCFVVPTTRPFDIFVWNRVKQILKKNAIDLIHVHGTRAFSNAFFAALMKRKPIVYTVHGWSFNSFQVPVKRRLSVLIETFFTRLADTTINVSNNNKQLGQKYIKSFKSEVIQNGIDLDKFNPDREYKDLRKEFGIPKDKVVIGFVARMTEQKDPITLIRAFNAVLEQATKNKYFLLFVGDGDLKDAVIKETGKLGLDKNVVYFESFRQDIPDILKCIDIFCLPSLWEGLSLGLLEAMAMKKAVIATAVDGTKEVVKNNENGMLFPPTNAEKLSELILEVGEDSDLREKIAEEALRTVTANYSVKRMTQSVEKVYDSLL